MTKRSEAIGNLRCPFSTSNVETGLRPFVVIAGIPMSAEQMLICIRKH